MTHTQTYEICSYCKNNLILKECKICKVSFAYDDDCELRIKWVRHINNSTINL